MLNCKLHFDDFKVLRICDLEYATKIQEAVLIKTHTIHTNTLIKTHTIKTHTTHLTALR